MKWVYEGKVYTEQVITLGNGFIWAKGDFKGANPRGYLLHRNRIKPLFSQYLDQIERADSTILSLKSHKQ